MSLSVIEGTWEEIEQRKSELIGRHLRVTIQPEKSAFEAPRSTKRPSVLGKYAFVAGGSEEFAREKQKDIEREDKTLE